MKPEHIIEEMTLAFWSGLLRMSAAVIGTWLNGEWHSTTYVLREEPALVTHDCAVPEFEPSSRKQHSHRRS
jgi:hypothetical protein